MSFPSISWSSDDRVPKSKMDESTGMIERDEDNKARIEDHDHDGSNSLLVDYGTETRRGTIRRMVATDIVPQVSSGDIYLTDDGTSGGNNVFDSSVDPSVLVLRSSATVVSQQAITALTWTDRGVGHDGAVPSGNSGTGGDYWTELRQSSGKWFVRIYNVMGAGNNYQYLVLAQGKGT